MSNVTCENVAGQWVIGGYTGIKNKDIWEETANGIYNDMVELLWQLDGDEDDVFQYGPAHIVWCDGNFNRSSIHYCIKHIYDSDYNLKQSYRTLVLLSLQLLLELPPYEEMGDEPTVWLPKEEFKFDEEELDG